MKLKSKKHSFWRNVKAFFIRMERFYENNPELLLKDTFNGNYLI